VIATRNRIVDLRRGCRALQQLDPPVVLVSQQFRPDSWDEFTGHYSLGHLVGPSFQRPLINTLEHGCAIREAIPEGAGREVFRHITLTLSDGIL
jgi:hypothetical protein